LRYQAGAVADTRTGGFHLLNNSSRRTLCARDICKRVNQEKNGDINL